MSFEPGKISLFDVCTEVDYGYTESATDKPVGPKFLRITDIQGGTFDWERVPFCLATESNTQKYRLKIGDVLIARTGNSTGENAQITKPPPLAVFASYLIRFRPDATRVNPFFIGYQLRSERFRNYVLSVRSGSAQPGANAKQLGAFPIQLIDRRLQDTAVETLRALDDRITLLRETNATLEAIAQALFKSWFVDFDPVRAKMEGRAPEGMDEATAALFPDGLEESELGLVPRGWGTRAFTDTVNVIGGGTPKTTNPEYWGGEIPWFSVVDAPSGTDSFVVDTEKHITDAGLKNSSTKLLPVGTTIISARGTVGRLALVGREMAMNQSCYGLSGKARDAYFTYFTTCRLVERLKQHSHGSVFDTITRETLASVSVVYPNEQAISQFESLLAPVMGRIKQNLLQAQTLATLRDTLLPRLISGQLRLPEAVEQVVDLAVAG